MLSNALICYAVAALLTAAAIFATVVFFKKVKTGFSVLAAVAGSLWFILMLVADIFIMLYAFSDVRTDYMSALMPQWLYKLGIVYIFVGVFSILRYIFVNFVFFAKYKKAAGVSFLVSYGLAPAVLVAIYCLFMFVNLGITALNTGFVELSAQSTLIFEDNSVVSVFTPFAVHIYLVLALVAFAALSYTFSVYMLKQSKYPFKPLRSVLMYVLLSTIELIMFWLLIFSASKIGMLAVAIIFVILAAVAVLSVKFLYSYKEQGKYDKQFEV